MAAIKTTSHGNEATHSPHRLTLNEPNPYLPAHFTSHFRLLDLDQDVLGLILNYAFPNYPPNKLSVIEMLSMPHRCRQNLANHPPPTALMQTCGKISSLAKQLWLQDLFHLYVASWTRLDENEALLRQVSGMTDLCITLDIRAGTPDRIISGKEGKLWPTSVARQICALVGAMQPAHGGRIRRLFLKVIVGKYAIAPVVAIIMESWRQLRVECSVKLSFVINYEEQNISSYGESQPGIVRPSFARRLVADMIGENVAVVGRCRLIVRRRDQKVFRLQISGATSGTTAFEGVRVDATGMRNDTERGAEECNGEAEAGVDEPSGEDKAGEGES